MITGANSGIGLEAAEILAGLGAHVVLACRSPAKGEKALARIRARHPEGSVELRRLDLADLSSVRRFADEVSDHHGGVDVLVNNAGVMTLPYGKTADGFEMQIGTNHLGHFALTGLMLPALKKQPGARVVTVSSVAHWFGKIRLDDLCWERTYSRWPAYAQSKLANLLFSQELHRRANERKLELTSVACHPGYASTNLQAAGARVTGSSFKERFMNTANQFLAQSAAMGAHPTVHAAVSPEVEGGDFIGPEGVLELHGVPAKRRPARKAQDRETAVKLWELSERLTGVRFDL